MHYLNSADQLPHHTRRPETRKDRLIASSFHQRHMDGIEENPVGFAAGGSLLQQQQCVLGMRVWTPLKKTIKDRVLCMHASSSSSDQRHRHSW